jgi:flagellar biosynthetic protein FlhB
LATALFANAGPWETISAAWAVALTSAFFAALAAGSVGWSPSALAWRASKLSVVAGAKSFFSSGALVTAIFALATACVVATGDVPAIQLELQISGEITGTSQQLDVLRAPIAAFWQRTAPPLAAIAAFEVFIARRRHARRLRMTAREVRDERAEQEGRPELKARRRWLGVRRARNIRVAALKRATALVTNPTRVAVALRYAPPAVDVPTVVSAAADLGAATLRVVAQLHGVPVVESPELARALFTRVDVDEPIPEELYAAVAAIFAWIIRTRGALPGLDPE